MKFIGNTSEYLHLELLNKDRCYILKEQVESSLTILWFQNDQNTLVIDGKPYSFKKNEIVFLTEFHKVEVQEINSLRFLRFNRSFYCIVDNDSEVGCKGVLFFGASQLPIISVTENELDTFETLWKMFMIEMKSNDNLQIDMLQMMLKRYLILCTRLYKNQSDQIYQNTELGIIREFNYLVEKHFKTMHTVADYAQLLNRSPKTLSNIFSKSGFKAPLKYIQDRKLLEAKRLLHYSNLQITEIAYDLGYEDIQSFSRFFKTQAGVSPKEFKENV